MERACNQLILLCFYQCDSDISFATLTICNTLVDIHPSVTRFDRDTELLRMSDFFSRIRRRAAYHCIKKKRNEFFYNAGDEGRTHTSTSKNKTIWHYISIIKYQDISLLL